MEAATTTITDGIVLARVVGRIFYFALRANGQIDISIVFLLRGKRVNVGMNDERISANEADKVGNLFENIASIELGADVVPFLLGLLCDVGRQDAMFH